MDMRERNGMVWSGNFFRHNTARSSLMVLSLCSVISMRFHDQQLSRSLLSIVMLLSISRKMRHATLSV